MEFAVTDISDLFPRALTDDEKKRAENLIGAALDLIEEAFLRHRRSFYDELDRSRLLQLTVKRVVREMVSEAVHVGQDVGRASVSSTTGPQSDSVTFSQGVGIHWGGVYLSNAWLRDLGLLSEDLGQVIPGPRKRYGRSGVAKKRSAEGAELSSYG